MISLRSLSAFRMTSCVTLSSASAIVSEVAMMSWRKWSTCSYELVSIGADVECIGTTARTLRLWISLGACLISSASLITLRASTARPESATTLVKSLSVSDMVGPGT